jgi:Rap1a immunity proteins
MRNRCALVCFLAVSALCNSQKSPLDLAGSGNGFLRYCEGPEGSSYGMCRGYVLGVVDGIQTVSSSFSDRICDPGHVTADQLYRIAVKYMRDHPQETHKFTAMLIFEASAGVFPCPAKK